jgi:hypothetical protein
MEPFASSHLQLHFPQITLPCIDMLLWQDVLLDRSIAAFHYHFLLSSVSLCATTNDGNWYVMWHIDQLLDNACETNIETTFVARQQPSRNNWSMYCWKRCEFISRDRTSSAHLMELSGAKWSELVGEWVS